MVIVGSKFLENYELGKKIEKYPGKEFDMNIFVNQLSKSFGSI